jgi:hypothetical protein
MIERVTRWRYQMALMALCMLRVIVRVEGPTPDSRVDGGPDRGKD